MNKCKILQKSDALFLESNYDDDMLLNGPYPYKLKKELEVIGDIYLMNKL